MALSTQRVKQMRFRTLQVRGLPTDTVQKRTLAQAGGVVYSPDIAARRCAAERLANERLARIVPGENIHNMLWWAAHVWVWRVNARVRG